MSSKRDQMFFDLEQRLAHVGKKLSAEEASSFIADDFLEFGSSGKVWSKAEIIAAMSEWSPIDRIVDALTVRELSATVCLITVQQRRNRADNFPSENQNKMKIDGGSRRCAIDRHRFERN